jgi:hypothetical protein
MVNNKPITPMKRWLLISVFSLSLLFIVASCESDSTALEDDGDDNGGTTKVEVASDYDWDESAAVTITLNGTSISASASSVIVNGTVATITAAGYYIISGTLGNGQIVVNAKGEEVKIKLNGVTVSNSSTSPFYIRKAAKAIIFLADGTTNTLTDASSRPTTDSTNACLYCKTYLAITGEGSLHTTGKYQDGIASADELIIHQGVISVTAVDDAIRGNDYLKITDGTISATSTSGHALKSDNTASTDVGYVQIDGGTLVLASSGGKGIQAVNSYIQHDGTITITKSYEGVESANITINGGTLDITATNDGLNATKKTVSGGAENNDGSAVLIAGGIVIANVSKGDALDSNGSLSVSGGLIVANGPTSGDGDAIDVNGTYALNGGTVVASGKSMSIGGMNGTAITGSQPYIKLSGTISSSTLVDIRINDSDVITFKPTYGGTLFILSSPGLAKGASYTIYTGGSYTTSANSGGYFSGGTYTAGTSKKSGTLSSSTTSNTISM